MIYVYIYIYIPDRSGHMDPFGLQGAVLPTPEGAPPLSQKLAEGRGAQLPSALGYAAVDTKHQNSCT